MPFQQWTGLLVSGQVDSAAVTNTTTETTILPGQANFVLPANFLQYAGQALRIRAMGRISIAASAAITLRVKFGSIAVAASPAFALNANAKTNVTWILDWDLTLRSVGGGTTATFMHSGQWQSEAVVGSLVPASAGPGAHVIPPGAPAVGTGFASTTSNIVDLTAQWGGASASNSITTHTYKLESLN